MVESRNNVEGAYMAKWISVSHAKDATIAVAGFSATNAKWSPYTRIEDFCASLAYRSNFVSLYCD